jgi:hypothetical protein
MALILNRESNPWESDPAETPLINFVSLILAQAILDKVDTIIFELDQQLHAKAETEFEKMLSEAGTKVTAADFMKASEIKPKAFAITFKTGEKKYDLAPAPGALFTPTVNVVLNAAAIPYWKKGEVSGEFETEKPSSKWRIESKDLTQRIQLRRIHAKQTLPN